VVPAPIPVATPLLSIVATLGALLDHWNFSPFVSFSLAVNCIVASTAIDGLIGKTVISASWVGVLAVLLAASSPPMPPMLLIPLLLTPKSVLPLLLLPKLPLPQAETVRSSKKAKGNEKIFLCTSHLRRSSGRLPSQ
jgi:hypothetical protein